MLTGALRFYSLLKKTYLRNRKERKNAISTRRINNISKPAVQRAARRVASRATSHDGMYRLFISVYRRFSRIYAAAYGVRGVDHFYF